ncbi:MAG TPA: universal stress protein [Longimicrobium sp.]|nr:universal stress protein [Longimicrobium sp.]
MEPFRSILVDIDATDSAQPALERAWRLARESGARLTIVDVMSVPAYARRYLPAGFEEEMGSRRRGDLERLAAGITDVPVETRLFAGRGGTALVDEVLASGHDLVVREAARDLVAPRREPSGAVNMEILRRCPCSVLLVGPGGAAAQPGIAAAVNPGTEDGEADQAMNARIAEMASLMADLEGGSVTLLYAWEVFAEGMVRGLGTPEGYADYIAAARRRAEDDLRRFTQSLRGRSSRVRAELRRGEPEDVIPEFVVAEGVDLLVMGSVARRGIAGFFIGNTAERVLPRLPCSVLVVKPGESEPPSSA